MITEHTPLRDKVFYVIPRADAAMWADCGWTIEELPVPHCFYSVHAWRWA